MQIPKAYNSKKYEDKIYENWEKKQLFNPDKLQPTRKEHFSIVLPPPNVTGTLHLGHAAMLAIEDLMIRYKRMQGFDTLWVPGTDHAAIATQNVVEKKLLKEKKKTRHDLGRKKFLQEVEKYVEQTKDVIHNQVRKMGSSLDWSREAYTLDEPRAKIVRQVFKKMFDHELIYRGHRIVNWCPRCHSTLADDEIKYKEVDTKFYTFKYSPDFPIAIATTRPETKLGDTAVAVHPQDKRYKKYIGKFFDVVFCGVDLKIKVIADKQIDPKFGTGALGVTPAHSVADYEMAEKNDLQIIKIIDEDGKMTDKVGKFAGMDVLEARKAVVKELKKQNLLKKVKDLKHNLSLCYRCDTPIEPLTSDQWFIDVNKKVKIAGNKYFSKGASLKQVALKVVRDGELKIIPKRFEKVYFHWMENLRDWCISRQIWFGHQIPVYYKGDKIHVNENAPKGGGWKQDEDTLDTWFSSGLWTFSTLSEKDQKRFHPTTVLETGYDILFFWVARMILMTTYVMGEVPFENVYLHGMIRDIDGDKMAKTKPETAIDPLDAGNKYGFDAVRLSLLIGNAAGNDIRLYDEKIEGYRNFVNKLWNISRYVLMTIKKVETIHELPLQDATLADRWILSRFNSLKKEVTKLLDKHNFSQAGELLREFTWNEFADWYLEIAKVEKNKDAILLGILKDLLKLWHPFVPFVTQAIWQEMGEGEIMISKWPEADNKFISKKIEDGFAILGQIITGIREVRATYKIPYSNKIDVFISVDKRSELVNENIEIIKGMIKANKVEVVLKKKTSPFDKPDGYVKAGVLAIGNSFVKIAGADMEKEKKRLEKEKQDLEKYFNGLEAKLKNKNFVKNAPKQVVKTEKEKLAQAKEKLGKIKTQLKDLK